MGTAAAVHESTGLYELLAELVSYPSEPHLRRAENCRRMLTAVDEEAASLLARYLDGTRGYSLAQLEENFTATFDLNPACTLEIGWHLFGEEYARGTFLVRMRGELRRCEVPESTELPDHLTHVLRVLARLEADKAADLTLACVLPAMEKMLAALAGQGNPYELVLQAIQAVLRNRCAQQEAHHD